MANIEWEPVDVTPHSVPRGKAYARVTPNSVTFNGVAASLIEDMEQYPWALVRVGRVDGEPTMLGFQFVGEQQPGAFPVKKQSKNHKGVTFFSRELVKQYFDFSGIGLVYLLLDVEKVDDTTLAIHLLTADGIREKMGLDKLEQELDVLGEKLGNLCREEPEEL